MRFPLKFGKLQLPTSSVTRVIRFGIYRQIVGARQPERDGQMLTIDSELLKAARKAHITPDWSAYKDMVVGLPYGKRKTTVVIV